MTGPQRKDQSDGRRGRPSGVVGGGGDVPSVAGPVGVDKRAWVSEQLVRVSAKVVSLRLDQIGRHCGRPAGGGGGGGG